MKKIATLCAVLMLFAFASPVFARGGSSGGGFSSSRSSSSFSSSSSRSSFSSSSSRSSGSFFGSSRSSAAPIKPSQASSIKPSQSSSIRPSQASSIRPSAVTPRPVAPRVYSYPTNNYTTINRTVVHRTYAYPVQPSYVYYREPSSGMGNFFFNMWLYQTLFSHDNRPQWNEQNGARPVVKVKDPEKNEDYEIWKNQWSTENVAFGMGGGLLQKLDRDTFKFAMKASYAKVGNEEILVYKEPITDHTKISKKGKLALVETMDGYETVMQGSKWYDRDVLETVFENGKIVKEYTFEEVRKNVAY